MQETHIIVDAKLVTLGVIARSKWTSAHPILARMVPRVLIIWEATVVRWIDINLIKNMEIYCFNMKNNKLFLW